LVAFPGRRPTDGPGGLESAVEATIAAPCVPVITLFATVGVDDSISTFARRWVNGVGMAVAGFHEEINHR